MQKPPPNGPRIIVGVDDSPGARWALAWALGEARLRRLPLHLVHAYQQTVSPAGGPWLSTGAAAAQATAAAMIARLLKEVAGGQLQDVEVSASVRPGAAGPVLAELSRSTDLLVVGRESGTVAGYCQRRSTATIVSVATPLPPAPATDEKRRSLLRRPFKRNAGSGSGEQLGAS
ncbi:universal stress protein [Nonomuraea soli]|uniref:Nucleotide-binding universal stress UspA family protein n=1 Tax=Nonomuraea soli TaxID=1032476 RepID=A0A7W0HNL9_9ACTN|nr:nucleotide-binding universal stress UspA family protein [Nonomuraea soli]